MYNQNTQSAVAPESRRNLEKRAEAFVAKAKASGEQSRKRLVSPSDFISEEIARLIKAGEIKAGERLIEVDLAARFGVSRTIIREAFAQLKRSGLAQGVRSRGLRVAVLTSEQIRDLYDVRLVLLRLAGQRAIERQDSACLALLEEGIPLLRALAVAQPVNIPLFVRVQTFIGSAMIVGAGNPDLSETIIDIDGRLSLFYLSTVRQERREALVNNWEMFVEAFKARDTSGGVAILERMIASSRAELLAQSEYGFVPSNCG
jgi:DNA-binding GntR family transcriptional regulator